MARLLLRCICSLVLLVASVQALKFDLHARPANSAKEERCIRNFVAKDTLVVVTAIVSGKKGDGMVVNMEVCSRLGGGAADRPAGSSAERLTRPQIRDAHGNEYGHPRDVAGEMRTVFTSHADASFDVCFENVLSGGKFCLRASAIHEAVILSGRLPERPR